MNKSLRAVYEWDGAASLELGPANPVLTVRTFTCRHSPCRMSAAAAGLQCRWYRRVHPSVLQGPLGPHCGRWQTQRRVPDAQSCPESCRTLSAADGCNEPRFACAPPARIVPMLAD